MAETDPPNPPPPPPIPSPSPALVGRRRRRPRAVFEAEWAAHRREIVELSETPGVGVVGAARRYGITTERVRQLRKRARDEAIAESQANHAAHVARLRGQPPDTPDAADISVGAAAGADAVDAVGSSGWRTPAAGPEPSPEAVERAAFLNEVGAALETGLDVTYSFPDTETRTRHDAIARSAGYRTTLLDGDRLRIRR